MDITQLNRGFPEAYTLSDSNRSPQANHLNHDHPKNDVIKQSDKLDLENLDPKDLAKAIKRAINESVIHKLFSALSRTNQGLFKDYNDNFTTEDATSSDPKAPTSGIQEDSSYQLTFQQSSFQSLDLSLSIDNNSFSLDLSYSRIETSQIDFQDTENGVQFSQTQVSSESYSLSLDLELDAEKADPLILDLDFSGFKFSSTETTVQFDINADGQQDSISNPQGADAFLAIDLNANGQIDNGKELFGDANGSQDGFQALAKYDQNNDQLINAQDAVFDQLLLLQLDPNGDQLISKLADQNVVSLSLDKKESLTDYPNDNQLLSSSFFEDAYGNKGKIGDFLLKLA